MTAVVDSRYELGEQIASGGMADVFAARDRTLDRQVAIKRLRADLSDEAARDRFTREAHALAGFSHENAVAVFDAGDDADGPYIVMELVEGPTLAAYLRERGRLSFEEATSIVEQLLAVLGAAHAQGIVHRDVKPANVLLAEDGRVKLADFGIAKMESDAGGDLTTQGHVLGTPTYLAPERVAGREATPQSDLYSLAVIGYEMVAGKPPFKGQHLAATLAAHQRAPIPSLLDVRPDAPATYVDAIERGLAKDPASRFASAEEMRHALMQLGQDETMAVRTLTMPVAPVPLRDPEPTPTPTPPPRRSKPAATTTKPKPTATKTKTKPAKTKTKTKTTTTKARSRPSVWPWVLVGVLVVGLVGGAIVGLTGNEQPLPDTSAQEPIVTTTPPTLPATLVPQVPQNLLELIALLGADPTSYGEKGPDLLAKLVEFEEKSDASRAEKILRDTAKWGEEGRLDPALVAMVIRLVPPAVDLSPDEPFDDVERDNGKGGVPPGLEEEADD